MTKRNSDVLVQRIFANANSQPIFAARNVATWVEIFFDQRSVPKGRRCCDRAAHHLLQKLQTRKPVRQDSTRRLRRVSRLGDSDGVLQEKRLLPF